MDPLGDPLYDFMFYACDRFRWTCNQIRDTWSYDFFAMVNRKERQEEKERKRIEKERRQGHQGRSGNTEYLPEEEVKNSREMEGFLGDEDEED